MLALVLHPTETRAPRHRVRASARRILGSDRISVRFEIEGARYVAWPDRKNSGNGARRDELWKQTCLECFIGGSQPRLSTKYFEWNFSPNGDWAAYAFENYRSGMSKPTLAEPAIARINDGEKTRFEIDLAMSDESVLGVPHLSLTAVILESDSSAPYYWALAHAGKKPDFHLRESFSLELES